MPNRLHQWFQHQRQNLLAQLLPCSCALCAQACPAVVCAACQQQFFGAVRTLRCAQCALPLTHDMPTPASASASLLMPKQICGACQQHAPAYDATFAAVSYEAPFDQLVLGLKFAARLGLAQWMAAMLRDALLLPAAAGQVQPPDDLPDLLCPVPLGAQRLVERGYNQALEIARPLSGSLGIALDARLCLRQHETAAQALLPLAERAKNLQHAFLVAPHAAGKIAGRHIGVVDDVMTSGGTLNEMAHTLKRFGARKVSNFVFARTPQPD